MPPRAIINSAGYKVLTSVDQYLELVGSSLPGKGPVVSSHTVLHGPKGWPGKRPSAHCSDSILEGRQWGLECLEIS